MLGADANADSVASPHRYHCLEDFEKKAGAIFDRTAIRVRASIGIILKKLIDQVAVSTVHLDAVEAGFHGQLRSPSVFTDEPGYFRQLDRPWH